MLNDIGGVNPFHVSSHPNIIRYLVSFRHLIFVMSLFLAIFRFNQTMKNVVSKLLENSTTDSDGTSGSEKVGELKIGSIESLD